MNQSRSIQAIKSGNPNNDSILSNSSMYDQYQDTKRLKARVLRRKKLGFPPIQPQETETYLYTTDLDSAIDEITSTWEAF